jgi:hypothetical protein
LEYSTNIQVFCCKCKSYCFQSVALGIASREVLRLPTVSYQKPELKTTQINLKFQTPYRMVEFEDIGFSFNFR